MMRIRSSRSGRVDALHKLCGPRARLLLFFAILLLHAPFPVLSRKIQLTWVNGIATHQVHMLEGQQELSKLFKEPVHYCYNPTAQSHHEDMVGWLGDLTQAGTQKMGRITDEVNALVTHLREALASVGKRGIVVHLAHSQGALITFLACKQLTLEEMQRMEIMSFGGAAALRKTPQTPFRRCINYYSVNDPLLWVAPSAAQSLRSGRVVGDADEEFCFLAPRAGDPIADHDLIGPTYIQALQWEAARFEREHRSLGYKLLYPVIHTTLSLLRMLHERFQLLVKTIIMGLLMGCHKMIQGVQSKMTALIEFVKTYLIRPCSILVLLCRDALRRARGQDQFELVNNTSHGASCATGIEEKHESRIRALFFRTKSPQNKAQVAAQTLPSLSSS